MNDPGEQKEKRHFFDDPERLKKMIRGFTAVCVLVFLSDAIFFLYHRHVAFENGEFDTETWFGFYAVFGFVAYTLLVVISKQLRKVLMRAEDYYDH